MGVGPIAVKYVVVSELLRVIKSRRKKLFNVSDHVYFERIIVEYSQVSLAWENDLTEHQREVILTPVE